LGDSVRAVRDWIGGKGAVALGKVMGGNARGVYRV